MGDQRTRQRVLDSLNGSAPTADAAVVRALKALADEIDTDRASSYEVRSELRSMKNRITTISIGAGTTVIITAILAALRLG